MSNHLVVKLYVKRDPDYDNNNEYLRLNYNEEKSFFIVKILKSVNCELTNKTNAGIYRLEKNDGDDNYKIFDLNNQKYLTINCFSDTACKFDLVDEITNEFDSFFHVNNECVELINNNVVKFHMQRV